MAVSTTLGGPGLAGRFGCLLIPGGWVGGGLLGEVDDEDGVPAGVGAGQVGVECVGEAFGVVAGVGAAAGAGQGFELCLD
jgi:hypothetical protein